VFVVLQQKQLRAGNPTIGTPPPAHRKVNTSSNRKRHKRLSSHFITNLIPEALSQHILVFVIVNLFISASGKNGKTGREASTPNADPA